MWPAPRLATTALLPGNLNAALLPGQESRKRTFSLAPCRQIDLHVRRYKAESAYGRLVGATKPRPTFWANQRLKKQGFYPAQDFQLHHHSSVEPASCLFTQAAKPRPHCRTSCPLSKASQPASTRKNKSCWICQNPLQTYDPINKNPVKITMVSDILSSKSIKRGPERPQKKEKKKTGNTLASSRPKKASEQVPGKSQKRAGPRMAPQKNAKKQDARPKGR